MTKTTSTTTTTTATKKQQKKFEKLNVHYEIMIIFFAILVGAEQ
jgi:hypothetical protein